MLDNLCHLLRLSTDDPSGCPPLLWLDRSALHHLQQRSPLRLQLLPPDQAPAAMGEAIRFLLSSQPEQGHWLRIDHPAGLRHAPVLLLEEHSETLADPDAAALLAPQQLLTYLQTLVDHARRHWAAHGLLCLASDLLRLLSLAWQSGGFGDLGDVAGRLSQLPSVAMASTGFCAHHTVAIENDLIVATDRVTLQAITLAAALWSWRSVRAIALPLQISPEESEPAAHLQAVLPHLDQRLHRPPSLAPLLQPPWSRLAEYINLAYGAAPVFHPPADLAIHNSGRRGKELLINDVGGLRRPAAAVAAPPLAGPGGGALRRGASRRLT